MTYRIFTFSLAIVAYLMIILLSMVLVSPAHSQFYSDHNGSDMALIKLPPLSIRIEYVRPKPELVAIGVRPGTMLIEGSWLPNRPNYFSGMARLFDPYCGMRVLPYPVTGGIEHGSILVLRGLAPILWSDCHVTFGVTRNSELVFTPLRPSR